MRLFEGVAVVEDVGVVLELIVEEKLGDWDGVSDSVGEGEKVGVGVVRSIFEAVGEVEGVFEAVGVREVEGVVEQLACWMDHA